MDKVKRTSAEGLNENDYIDVEGVLIDAIQEILRNGKTEKSLNSLMSYQELKAILHPKNKKMADLYFSEKEQIELRENLKSFDSDKDYERRSKKIFKLLFD